LKGLISCLKGQRGQGFINLNQSRVLKIEAKGPWHMGDDEDSLIVAISWLPERQSLQGKYTKLNNTRPKSQVSTKKNKKKTRRNKISLSTLAVPAGQMFSFCIRY